MSGRPSSLHVVTYCLASGVVGTLVGAVAGLGIAGMVLRPEEAVVLVAGLTYGIPIGAAVGILLGIRTMHRRSRG